MWYLNPKNIALMLLGVLFLVVGTLYLIQRTTVAKQVTTIETQKKDILDLKKTNTELQGQIADAKANVLAAQEAQRNIQTAHNNAAVLSNEARKITATCIIGGKDEKRIDDVFMYFNDGGLLNNPISNSKTGKEVLSETDKANSSNTVKQRYSLNQIIQNCATVISYVVELEKGTIACYEGGN
jgi:hypothetical protein